MKPNTVFFRCVCCVWILLLSSIAFTGQSPANDQATRKIKVYVSVDCDDENAETLIKSWTKRELRNLGDIDIVGIHGAEVMIILQIQEPTYENTENKTGGIVISYIFLHRVPGSTDTNPHFYFPESGLATGDKDEHLEGFCKKIVAQFDVKTLEPFRIVAELAEESVKKYFQK